MKLNLKQKCNLLAIAIFLTGVMLTLILFL
jgi:hypothetical protein